MKISKLFYISARSLLNFFGFGQGNCLYYPTCSEIMKNSIEKKGFIASLPLLLKRIYVCNPIYMKFCKR